MTAERPILATVCGSFRRHLAAVQDTVYELTDAGARVLSPADPRVVDQFGDFVFVASDVRRVIRLVENRHLAAIAASDLVMLVCPDGYVGASAALEIGFAHAAGTPVYSTAPPADLTLRQFVHPVDGVAAALRHVVHSQGSEPNLLLDPTAAVEHGHEQLDVIHQVLVQGDLQLAEDDPRFWAATRALGRLTEPGRAATTRPWIRAGRRT